MYKLTYIRETAVYHLCGAQVHYLANHRFLHSYYLLSWSHTPYTWISRIWIHPSITKLNTLLFSPLLSPSALTIRITDLKSDCSHWANQTSHLLSQSCWIMLSVWSEQTTKCSWRERPRKGRRLIMKKIQKPYLSLNADFLFLFACCAAHNH